MTIETWTIYDHPRDWPNHFVARRFEGETPTPEVLYSTDLDQLRMALLGRGLVPFARHQQDDPVIVETWL
ncbi:hypothetical protein IVA80_15135 [Bradyrhizobium sp. 139]|uniref:hypothetical protein n=1 Tax=Bradyrhizobium sp. 139 TaxID=2782616 RepID=UPI001FFBC235|nr:hypothetical protein [Bradyrhizobium sp. 139]MCK1742157.1 hypothetical protein [Bradyrhizobium sp. 139]